MEEIMLKNIWEIENNPIFSLGASIKEGNDSSNVKNGAIKQLNSKDASCKKALYNINYQ
jgi:hypothetical protein